MQRIARCLPLLAALTLMDGREFHQRVEPSEYSCIPKMSYQTYEVQGSSMSEWRASMLRDGPRDTRGIARFARADWNVAWRWKLDPSERIDPSTIEIECGADLLLPGLKPSLELSPEEWNNWFQFSEKVRKHELNHLRHAFELAPRIKSAILAQKRSLTPEQGNALGYKVLQEMRSLDRQYDLRTNHGSSEGIW